MGLPVNNAKLLQMNSWQYWCYGFKETRNLKSITEFLFVHYGFLGTLQGDKESYKDRHVKGFLITYHT